MRFEPLDGEVNPLDGQWIVIPNFRRVNHFQHADARGELKLGQQFNFRCAEGTNALVTSQQRFQRAARTGMVLRK